MTERATFHRMDECTQEDWNIIIPALLEHAQTSVAGEVLGPDGVTPPLSHYTPLIENMFGSNPFG